MTKLSPGRIAADEHMYSTEEVCAGVERRIRWTAWRASRGVSARLAQH